MLDRTLQHRLDVRFHLLVGDNIGILKLCQDRCDMLFEFVEKRFLMAFMVVFVKFPTLE